MMLDGWAADRLCERLTSIDNTASGIGKSEAYNPRYKVIRVPDEPQRHVVEQTELTDECINRIADAVVRKLREMEGAKDERKVWHR